MDCHKHFSVFFLAVLLSFFVLSKQDEAPQTVYRADFRDPDEIFAHGFRTLGNNNDLFDHISGTSCQSGANQNSAFTAMTSVEKFARKWCSDNLWSVQGGSRFMYVYEICATKNFYNAYNSLMNTFHQTKKTEYKFRAEMFKAENEWVAYKGVPRDLVKGATKYEKGEAPTKLKQVSERINPFYSEANTAGNKDPFQVSGVHSTSVVTLISGSIAHLSACFKSCPKTSNSDGVDGESKPKPSTSPTQNRLFQMSLKADKGTIWDPISSGPKERHVPWKKEEKTENNHLIEKPAGCTIEIESVLRIQCPKNKFYEKFVVILKGEKGDTSLFHSENKDGMTGHKWTRFPSEIELSSEGGSLEDKGYTLEDVFNGSDWHSQIRILPVYPIFYNLNGESEINE